MNSTLRMRLAVAAAILFAAYGFYVAWQERTIQMQAYRADAMLVV